MQLLLLKLDLVVGSELCGRAVGPGFGPSATRTHAHTFIRTPAFTCNLWVLFFNQYFNMLFKYLHERS